MTHATGFVDVAAAEAVQEGKPLGVELGADDPVCLVRVGEAIYAFEDRCPHRGAKLSEGWLEGTTLTCKQHTWEYDVTTGKLLRLRAPVCLTMREARITDGRIEVERR